ncbi:VPS10 domain-containing protein [Candidatus Palauibacter sp.]|uniref:VPS10 domain-containing protein n=1 Tax=Candidatus Palauibacter sp. TaxID=3101350 RepID=UPI003AF1EE60
MRTRSTLAVSLSFVPLLAVIAGPCTALAQDSDMAAAVAALEWREIGPTIMGGRIADIAVVESDPSTFYVGVATGGLWKTTDHGTTFEPVFDDQPMLSIGDVTVAPSNPNVVWVGSGEPQNRQSSPWGMGVFRSTDAGRTWTHLGLDNTHHISRIQVDPGNPDMAYVAAMGHLWGSNSERGVYRTMDGGRTWQLVLYVDEHTGAIDLAMDPADPKTLFAAMYQRQRKVWGFNGGGPGSGLYRTTDGGDTWTRLADGLPEGGLGRIGIDIYRRDGNLLMAIVEADKRAPGQVGGPEDEDANRLTGVYKSTDRGETWTQVSTTNNRPMYYSQIRIDPNDPERVYLGGRDLYRSSDGGNHFTPDAASDVHPDHHALWINPANSDHLILGGDGGVSISWNRSGTWRQLRNLPLAQFYEIDIDDREPYHVCGGLQDNGSWCAPSETWSDHGIRPRDWYNVGMSDGYFTVLHPDGETMLVEAEDGRLMRTNLKTGERLWIRPLGRPEEDAENPPDYRWNWNAPIEVSPSRPSTVYIGGNILFRSTDYGQTWEQISPDLTKNIDRETLEIMGVLGSEPMMSANDGTTSFGSLISIEESPLDPMVVYVGTDDGNLQVTRDGGATWTNTAPNMPGAPDQLYMTRIVASHADAGTVWVAGDNHRDDDMAPYVYVSNDFGESWRAITNGLPDGWSLNALQQHLRAANLLFAGNEIGTYFSIDAGNSWHPLRRNMPPAPVDDIKIQARENDLVVGTHGRGIWIMEDITPLEEMSRAVLASDAHLFSTQAAVAYNSYAPQSFTPGIFEAENPPPGARIRYWLGSDLPEAPESTTVTILNGDGEVLRTLEGGGTHGLHEVMWDLRLEPVPPTLGGGDFYRAAATAPRVLPGTYTARLEAAGHTLETSVTVRLDPRLNIGWDELTARQEALMRAYELAKPTNEGLQAAARLRGHLSDIGAWIEGHDAAEWLMAEVEAIGEELDAIGEALERAHTGADVSGSLSGYHTAPTADMLYQIERGGGALPGAIDRLNILIEDRMPALYAALGAEAVRPDLGAPIKMPVRPMRGRSAAARGLGLPTAPSP